MASVLDTANALVSLADLKAYLSADTGDEFLTDTSTDNELERLINSASLYANNYTGVALLSRSHTEYHDGDGSQVLFLDNFPVTSTESEIALYIDSDREYAAGDRIPASSIILYPNTGKLMVEDHYFERAPRSVKITYTAGYALASVPADLAYAVKVLCAKMWKMKKDKLSGVVSMTIEGQSVNFAEQEIPGSVREILNRYSRNWQGTI
jgi:hypothetical protein